MRPTWNNAECRSTEPDIPSRNHRPGVVNTQLYEPGYAAGVAIGTSAPQSLRRECVNAVGSVLCDRASRSRQRHRPGLVPGADGEGSGQIVRPEQPGSAGLTDLEPVSIKGRRGLQTGLPTCGCIAIVAAEGDVELTGRRDRSGNAVSRVVITGESAEDRRVHEYRRIEEPAHGRNPQRQILHRNRPNDVTEIVGWNGLSDPHQQLVGEEGLPPPKFIEFRSVQ